MKFGEDVSREALRRLRTKLNGQEHEPHPPPVMRVVCVRWGDKYDLDYVYRLRSMVMRHLTIPHTFTCYTDNPRWYGLDNCREPHVEFEALPGLYEGWWSKIELFKPGLIRGPALYIDLDMLIVRSIDWVSEFLDADLAAIENWGSRRHEGPLYEDELSSAFMAWSGSGATDAIFSTFTRDDIRRLHPHGDQTFITEVMRGKFALIPQERIASYKRHCRDQGGPPSAASVVAFHGTPRPHEVLDPWVIAGWR